MRISTCLLTVTLLAVILCSPTAPAQQTGAVNVRPRITSKTPGLPTVNISVDRQRVPLGELVTFTLSPANVVLNPNYIVMLDFGDRQRTRVQTAVLSHLYEATGTYRYSIAVSPAKDPGKRKVPQVTLSAQPTSAQAKQPIDFRARLSEPYPNIKYRFVFADGRETAWQDGSHATHDYATPKTYLAYVEIGTAGTGKLIEYIGGSIRVPVHILLTPAPPASVNLSAKPAGIEEGETVSFVASVSGNRGRLTYRFIFGDKSAATGWQSSPQARHRYQVAGAFSAHVEVRESNNPSGAAVSSTPTRIDVRAAPKPVVNLYAAPTSVMENLPIFFTTRVDPPTPGLNYRFNFGDGSGPTAWSAKATVTHAYARAGSFGPLVEIGRSRNGTIAAFSSSRRQVTVDRLSPDKPTPTPSPTPSPAPPSPTATSSPSTATPSPTANTSSPSPNGTATTSTGPISSPSVESTPGRKQDDGSGRSDILWFLLVAALLFGGYRAWNWLAPAKPTFHPRLDPGVSKVDSDLSIDFQIQLNPDIGAGDFGLDTPTGTFIKSERKVDD